MQTTLLASLTKMPTRLPLLSVLAISLFSSVSLANSELPTLNFAELKICKDIDQQQNCVISYFKDWDFGTKNDSDAYRVLLNRDDEGRYIVQDFYRQSHHKKTDPFIIRHINDLQSQMDDYTMTVISIDGDYIGWYDNGQQEFEFHYQHGNPIGVWLGWAENGQLIFADYKTGDKADSLFWWYDDGQPRSAKEILPNSSDSLPRWLETEWYQNGQKKSEGIKINHSKDGLWTYWYENGQLKEKTHYQQGEIVGLPEKWQLPDETKTATKLPLTIPAPAETSE